MTSIIQALGDFLNWIITPIYALFVQFFGFINDFLFNIVVAVCYLLSLILSGLCIAFGYVADRFMYNISQAISILFPSGLINTFSGGTNFVTNLTNYGLVGVTWLKAFVDVSVIISPIATYLGFMLVWGIYKFVKSWIPTVSG